MAAVLFRAVKVDAEAMYRYNLKIDYHNVYKEMKEVKWDDAHVGLEDVDKEP